MILSLISFDSGLGLAVGYIAGAFTPSIGRRIKSLFVKSAADLKVDVAKLEAKLQVAVAKAAAAGEAEAKKELAKV